MFNHKLKPISKSSTISQILPIPKDKLNLLMAKGFIVAPARVRLFISVKLVGRFSEHERCLRCGLLTQSAVTEHHYQTGHQILFDYESADASSSINMKYVNPCSYSDIPKNLTEMSVISSHKFGTERFSSA